MSKIISDFPMSKITTLQIGGPAREFLVVKTDDKLIETIQSAKKEKKDFLVIGGGSNLLVSDEGVNKLVIKNEVSGITLHPPARSHLRGGNQLNSRGHLGGGQNGVKLTVKSGTPLQELVDFSVEHGLSGLQKLTGIPGTIGGAVYGNAAAYGQTISEYITEVTAFDGANIKKLTNEECNFSYRDSVFKRNGFIILEITFQLTPADPEELKKESAEILEKRLAKYKPGILCPGSFFKNVLIENLTEEQKKLIPPERDYYGKVPAWFFLDEVGARGDKKGQIKIADFHGNLFMNLGGGAADDFYKLAKHYAERVKEKFNIKLEPEVQLINLPPIN